MSALPTNQIDLVDEGAERKPASENIPPEWLEGLKRLGVLASKSMAKRDGDLLRPLFARVLADARAFWRAGWMARAAALGWRVTELFGVHPKAPEIRGDCKGLVCGLCGRAVEGLTDGHGLIRCPDGNRLRFTRATHDTYGLSVPIWEIAHDV